MKPSSVVRRVTVMVVAVGIFVLVYAPGRTSANKSPPPPQANNKNSGGGNRNLNRKAVLPTRTNLAAASQSSSMKNETNSTLSISSTTPIDDYDDLDKEHSTSPTSSTTTDHPLGDEGQKLKASTTANKKKKNKREKASKDSISKASSSSTSATLARIRKEYKDAVESGIAYDWGKQRLVKSKKAKSPSEKLPICIGPLSSNLKHWHFSFVGCGIFERGLYHGVIILPKDYPGSPPRVQMWTPNGRFVPGIDICLSASAYHPETWTRE
jgi:ubiquitin-protein ligase